MNRTLYGDTPGGKKSPGTRGESLPLLVESSEFVSLVSFRKLMIPYAFFGEENILPLSGTREGLFSISLVLSVKQIIVPNPFYQVYLGASLFQNLPIAYMNADIKENYLLDLDRLRNKIKKKNFFNLFLQPI